MDSSLRQMQYAKQHKFMARRTGTFQVEQQFVDRDADPKEADLEYHDMQLDVIWVFHPISLRLSLYINIIAG